MSLEVWIQDQVHSGHFFFYRNVLLGFFFGGGGGRLKIHYSLHEILARKKPCKVKTVNWFLFRYHMGQGHTLWILRKPQEIYSGNKDGVCRHQESPGERTSHCLPGKLDKITMAFNRTLNYWFFLTNIWDLWKFLYIHSSQHDSCKEKLWFIHKSEKRYFKHNAV